MLLALAAYALGAQTAPGATIQITHTSGAGVSHGLASAATAERWVELVAVLVLAGVIAFPTSSSTSS